MDSSNFLFVSTPSRFSKVAENALKTHNFPYTLLHLDSVQSRIQASKHPQYPITHVPTLLVAHPSGVRIRYVGVEEIVKYISTLTRVPSHDSRIYGQGPSENTPESESSDDDIDFPPLPVEEVEGEIEEVIPILTDEPIPMSTSQLETPQDFVPPNGMKDVMQRAAEMEKQREETLARFASQNQPMQ